MLTSVQVSLVVAFNCVHVELVPGFKLAQLGVVGIVTSDQVGVVPVLTSVQLGVVPVLTSVQVGVVPVLTSVHVPLVVAFILLHVEPEPESILTQFPISGTLGTLSQPLNTDTSPKLAFNNNPSTSLDWPSPTLTEPKERFTWLPVTVNIFGITGCIEGLVKVVVGLWCLLWPYQI